MKKSLLSIALLLSYFGSAYAQDGADEKGWLSGSFETNSILYLHDKKSDITQARYPADHIGSNNYLKLDYMRSNFSAGIQLESYLPVLTGFPTGLTGTDLTFLYASWTDKNFSVTAGNFYDQFGSGLLFRAWEERTLGFNNALQGARFTYQLNNFIAFKAIWGRPRLDMEYFDTQVRGADLSIGLSELFGWQKTSLFLEGSVLNTYQAATYDQETINPNNVGYSVRLNFERSGFSLKGEYVDRGDNYYTDMSAEGFPTVARNGNAQLLEFGYNNKGLGIFLTGRRLQFMKSYIDRSNMDNINNMMSYIPAMTMQYTYLLTTLNPYNPQLGDLTSGMSGEIGGQADIFYNVKRGTALGGKRGMKLHANFSTYYGIDGTNSYKARNMAYRDFSFDFEKQWSRVFKSNILYSLQDYNHSYGAQDEYWRSHIIVADLLFKATRQTSFRVELQYLFTEDDNQDWMAGLLEVNFAPKWSVYVSDMYNNGNKIKEKRIHYYNAGFSYAHSRTRLQLSYGRNKAGYVCSGGVCREQPAYTGVNFAMTIAF